MEDDWGGIDDPWDRRYVPRPFRIHRGPGVVEYDTVDGFYERLPPTPPDQRLAEMRWWSFPRPCPVQPDGFIKARLSWHGRRSQCYNFKF